MEIPSTTWSVVSPETPETEAPLEGDWEMTNVLVEHTFTHFHLKLGIWRTRLVTGSEFQAAQDCQWVLPQDLMEQALPTVMKKIVTEMAPASIRPRR